jgi:aryl-alcohol dehydrogenase-like predicted oxidoreductase
MDSMGNMPYRTLGRTGERVSLVGLGGAHLGSISGDQEAIRLIRAAIDGGINFMDNSWDYHGGVCESRMGRALKDGYRERVFLMTKIDGQTREAAALQIEESFRRLQVDVIDLLQFHEIIRMEDPRRIFGPGGAMEAVREAKDAGRIRYIGFTGHKDPDIHLEMLGVAFGHGFTFDTVQMPLNPLDAHFRSFEKKVLPVLLEHDIGVLAMKPLAGGRLMQTGTVSAVEALHYVMNLPVSVVITGCESMEVLQQALEAARTFRPLGKDEVESLLERTAAAAEEGRYERFKTTHDYDATHAHPEWLG